MKVIAYPADTGGCGSYRIIWPGTALANQGADVEVVMPDDPAERQLLAAYDDDPVTGRRIVHDVKAPECDVVVIQRPLTSHNADAVELLQAKGVRVVVEIDDDFEHISRRNVSYRAIDPNVSPNRNRKHLMRACAAADLVTVSTPALAAVYAPHGRVAILPNYVPAGFLAIEREPRDGVFVGWSGSIETHPDDLQQCGRRVARVVAKTGATFAVIGTGRGVKRALSLNDAPTACGWRPIEEYPHAVAQLDVGIVPLERSAFNEAKSWLKGLEMAALGVPFVATPTDEYRRLSRMGAGLLAEKQHHWEGAVKRLIVDEAWRVEVAERGRDTARGLTIGQHCERWWDAWRAVVNTRCAV